jgi:hypothetical protein
VRPEGVDQIFEEAEHGTNGESASAFCANQVSTARILRPQKRKG